MKINLVSTFFLAAAFSPFTLKSAEIELVVGTYQEGNNITEPRPAESQYFRTRLGAFQLIQGMAGYKVFIDVIKRPEKRIYTRAILQNPQDPKAPFVYDHYIDPENLSTTLTHGPVQGLKIYQDYTVELIAYSDKTRTNEVDHLTQKIRSYVDTTGKILKLFDGMNTKSSPAGKQHTAPPSVDPAHQAGQ